MGTSREKQQEKADTRIITKEEETDTRITAKEKEADTRIITKEEELNTRIIGKKEQEIWKERGHDREQSQICLISAKIPNKV